MKRSNIVFWGSVVLILLNAGPCLAQAGLTLQEAIDKALQSRASLKAEAERVSTAEGLRKQAGLLPNPEFQFQNENLRPGQTYSRDVDTLALINQPLDVLGKRKQRVGLAGEGVTRSQAEYELARWQVAQKVKFAYWTARGSQEVQRVLQTTLDNFQKIIDYHSAQLSAGAIAEQDLLRVRLEGERLKISADLASIEGTRSQAALLKEMGQTDFSEIVLTEPLAVESPVTPLSIEEVLAQRIEIKVARAALEQAKANAKLQDVSARPDLNVTYGYKRTQLPDALTGVNTAIVSLRITLPTTDKNQGNRMAAESEVRRQQQLLAAAEADIRADYGGALQEFQLRRAELVNALQPLREHAATIAQIAAAAYAEGGTDLLRLLDAERARLDAELAWARGMVDYRQSVVRLEAAEGVN
ncbi:MAG TPA: TolC family protein [Terriglobales bacterium]|nr:TolC family protein [Terriglobales bacterium]